MTTTICDSSAVDNYLRELSNREAERTRSCAETTGHHRVPATVRAAAGALWQVHP